MAGRCGSAWSATSSPPATPYIWVPNNFPLYNLVYDTLLVYDQQLNPRPRLALSWAWSSDYRQLDVQLRPGVTFHSGRPFTSDDVKFNLEQLRDPAAASQWLPYARLMQVSTPGPETVRISFDAPARSAFDMLSFTYMADPEVTSTATATVTQFVGTGPFRVQEWQPVDHLTVLADPTYWQPGSRTWIRSSCGCSATRRPRWLHSRRAPSTGWVARRAPMRAVSATIPADQVISSASGGTSTTWG